VPPATLTASVLRLESGHDLAFACYGDPEGVPVFGFHGTPGSRRQVGEREGLTIPPGCRLIAPDRPGYGHSSFQPDRRLVDWPGDVTAIADYLGLERFGIFGVSGGGPHALVCAHALGPRLLGVACVSGVAPLDRPEAAEGMLATNRTLTWLARRWPRLLRRLFPLQTWLLRRFPERFFAGFLRQLPEADRRILERPAMREAFLAELRDAPATAGRAAAQDFLLFANPWGFRLEDIRVPVHFWQGHQDRNVPPHHARLLAEPVPDSTLHEYPDEGHLLAFDHLDEILRIASGKAG
jgi:pimeloyl-ACP methyl ester carboxylesterase